MSKQNPTTAEGDLSLNDSGESLSPEQMALNDTFDLGPHLVTLYWEEPFFATMYKYVHRVRSRTLVPTAGMGIIRGRPTLIWNPDFMATLSAAQVRGILKHEIYHLIYDHITTRVREPFTFWNWAADLAINGSIPRKELPAAGLIPGEPLHVTPEQKAKMKPEERARFEHLSELIESFPPLKTAEWYFSRLMQDDVVRDMVAEARDAQKKLEEMMSEALRQALEGGDHHDGWGQSIDENGQLSGELSGSLRQLLEGELRQALSDAVSEADGSNKWGSVPMEMQKTLRSMIRNEVDWRSVLRTFIGMSRRASAKNSRKKVNRKVPYIFPGRSRNYTANIAVFVDMSGSVSDKYLEMLFGELRSLAKKTTITFFPFDTEVDVENSFAWRKGETRPELTRTRCGGTDFQACINYANENKDQFDGILILTDGYAPAPGPCRMRVGWVITPDGSTEACNDGCVVIKLTEQNDD